MNLIFITVDGARADRIKNGRFFKKLIEKSAFFSNVIAYAPYTIAAMHAVFSGVYGTKSGVNSYWSSSKFKKEQYKTLTSYLHDIGYNTIGDVINKLVLPSVGFDELVVHDELHDNLLERHKNLLERVDKIRKKGEKFFLYLHYSNIHTGIMQEVLKKYNNFSKEYFSNHENNKSFYNKLFADAENYLEEIFQYYEQLGLNSDTLMVVISDHGISTGEKFGERAYGVYCYDYTVVSTALFYHKDLPSKQIDAQVRSIDILPTILDVLSIPMDLTYESFDGKSLIPFLHGEKDSRIALCQSGNPLDNEKPPLEPNVWAIRTDEWKFIRNIYDKTEEMYYLKNDPNEENNVIDVFPERANELRLELERMLKNNFRD